MRSDKASPQDSKLLFLLGVLKDLEGQHWEAQAYHRDGLARARGDRGLTVNLALSLAVSGDSGSAIGRACGKMQQSRYNVCESCY